MCCVYVSSSIRSHIPGNDETNHLEIVKKNEMILKISDLIYFN